MEVAAHLGLAGLLLGRIVLIRGPDPAPYGVEARLACCSEQYLVRLCDPTRK